MCGSPIVTRASASSFPRPTCQSSTSFFLRPCVAEASEATTGAAGAGGPEPCWDTVAATLACTCCEEYAWTSMVMVACFAFITFPFEMVVAQ